MPVNTSIKSSYKSIDLWKIYLKNLNNNRKGFDLKNLENSLAYAIKNHKKSLININKLKKENFG